MRKNKALAHCEELQRKYSWQYCCNDRFRPLLKHSIQSHLGEAVNFFKKKCYIQSNHLID